MSSTNWNAARASTWLKRFADDLGHDAYHERDDDLRHSLFASAGPAYYAVIHGVGYNTRQEFIDFLERHLFVSEDFIEDALEEIEGGSNI